MALRTARSATLWKSDCLCRKAVHQGVFFGGEGLAVNHRRTRLGDGPPGESTRWGELCCVSISSCHRADSAFCEKVASSVSVWKSFSNRPRSHTRSRSFPGKALPIGGTDGGLKKKNERKALPRMAWESILETIRSMRSALS